MHNLYRHPDRQDAVGKFPHSKIYDIYSIGVVFLELGLGRSAPELRRYHQATPKKDSLSPEEIKQGFLRSTQNLLPELTGHKYSKVVEYCLLGELDIVDGEEVTDMSIHKAFRENVVDVLETIGLTI